MDLRRIFANAIARRVAYVVVAIALAWFGLGDARAQSGPGQYPSQLEARLACELWLPNLSNSRTRCYLWEYTSGDYTGQPWRYEAQWASNPSLPDAYGGYGIFGFPAGVSGCAGGEVFFDDLMLCDLPCDQREALGPGAWSGFTNGFLCKSGCAYGQGSQLSVSIVVDGVEYTSDTSWVPNGQQCSVASQPQPVPTDSDGDGSSDDNDLSPNNPGESGDGGGQDNSTACGGPSQPACSPDGSNEGSGKGNTSGGGGNCQTPPRSSGDAILAQIAFQAWATRCAIEGNANQGGGTGGTPGGDGDGVAQEIMDYLDGNGQQLEDPQDPWIEGDGPEPSDWSLGLGSGSCPAPISETVSLGGHSATIAFSFQPLCDLAGLLNTVFRALGLLIGAYIIAGVRR